MNKTICESLLSELSQLESNRFKSSAYENAKFMISRMTDDEFNNRESFLDIKGIGSSINGKILEIRESGRCEYLDDLRTKSIPQDELYKVRKSYTTKRIFHDQAQQLYDHMLSLAPHIRMLTAGSFRRMKRLVGDLDIIVSQDNYQELVQIFRDNYGEPTVSGASKSSFIIDKINNVPVDVYSCDPKRLAYMQLYLTGSAKFNIMNRAKAKELGYTLNQYGLYDDDHNDVLGDNVTEKDILIKIGVGFVPPEYR